MTFDFCGHYYHIGILLISYMSMTAPLDYATFSRCTLTIACQSIHCKVNQNGQEPIPRLNDFGSELKAIQFS